MVLFCIKSRSLGRVYVIQTKNMVYSNILLCTRMGSCS
nr:MAG TPA: hypothetical protein [Caudoviricetes sp.]